jgi:hypothetical protein
MLDKVVIPKILGFGDRRTFVGSAGRYSGALDVVGSALQSLIGSDINLLSMAG